MTGVTSALMLAAMLTSAAAAIVQPPLPSDLQRAREERRRAHIEGDEATIERIMADEYIQTDVNGRVQDKTTWMNEYFKPLAALIKAGQFHWDTFREDDVIVRLLDDAAVEAGLLVLKGRGIKMDGGRMTVSPGSTVETQIRFTRVWVNQRGRWLLLALHNATQPS